jgi:hypothetical protein
MQYHFLAFFRQIRDGHRQPSTEHMRIETRPKVTKTKNFLFVFERTFVMLRYQSESISHFGFRYWTRTKIVVLGRSLIK